MESAQPEIMEYHERVETAAIKRDEETNGHVRGHKQGKKGFLLIYFGFINNKRIEVIKKVE